MKCPACQAEIPATARFCPSCATPLLKDEDVKSPAEVSAEWLKAILEAQRYKIEIGERDTNVLIARHDTSPNLIVSLRQNISLITVQSLWNLKKPSWSQKAEFLAAINKANSIHWLCACYSSDSMDDLNISTAIYLTERVSSRDIAAFLEMFTDGVMKVLDHSGIKKFSE